MVRLNSTPPGVVIGRAEDFTFAPDVLGDMGKPYFHAGQIRRSPIASVRRLDSDDVATQTSEHRGTLDDAIV
jgi:hypothetical protein